MSFQRSSLVSYFFAPDPLPFLGGFEPLWPGTLPRENRDRYEALITTLTSSRVDAAITCASCQVELGSEPAPSDLLVSNLEVAGSSDGVRPEKRARLPGA
jgi:hypothetical protein